MYMCTDLLLLQLMVDDHERRIETLEATVEKLMKMVETLQSRSEQSLPSERVPSPAVASRCPIQQHPRQLPTHPPCEHYENADIFLGSESPPLLPPTLPLLSSLPVPPPVPPRCPIVHHADSLPDMPPPPPPQQLPSLPLLLLSKPSSQSKKKQLGSLPSSSINKTELKSPWIVIMKTHIY